MEISKRIKDLRKEKNITQKDLAKALGQTNTSVSNYEQGVSTPDLDTAIKIARFFCCSLDYLTGLSNERFREVEVFKNKKSKNLLRVFCTDAKDRLIFLGYTHFDIKTENPDLYFVLCSFDDKTGGCSPLAIIKETTSFKKGDTICYYDNSFKTSDYNDKIKNTQNILGVLVQKF